MAGVARRRAAVGEDLIVPVGRTLPPTTVAAAGLASRRRRAARKSLTASRNDHGSLYPLQVPECDWPLHQVCWIAHVSGRQLSRNADIASTKIATCR
jgi:hypothetical protein